MGWSGFFFELGRSIARRLEFSQVIARDLIQAAGRESISNPARSLFVVIPELLTLSAGAYAGMPDTDGFRDALRWCARTRSHLRVVDGFMDAMEQVFANPTTSPPGIFGVLQNFGNFAPVLQSPANLNGAADFRNFDFPRYRTQIVGTIRENDVEQGGWIESSPYDRLCRNHALRALHMLHKRRQSEDGHNGNQANTVFACAAELRSWVQARLGQRASFVAQATWMSPWLDVEFANDALLTNLELLRLNGGPCSASFGCRLVAIYRFSTLADESLWPRQPMKATTTLVAMSPELFGFYLLLWELLIRTQPHDSNKSHRPGPDTGSDHPALHAGIFASESQVSAPARTNHVGTWGEGSAGERSIRRGSERLCKSRITKRLGDW